MKCGMRKKILFFLKNLLTGARLCSSLYRAGSTMTIRDAIQKELRKRGWSYYRLAKELEGKMPARTIYAYLSGDCDLVSERVSIILETLGLTIKAKSNKKQTNRIIKRNRYKHQQ